MSITIKDIKAEFKKAESTLDFCWMTLTNMHAMLNRSTSLNPAHITNLILFQEQLATSIFRLQSIREKIILEEKRLISNKKQYKIEWFVKRLQLLSKFKEGIDKIVNISKSFGDAYAYFFYQSDIELLSDHYSHKRVVNNCAGIGERGELEFIKNIKHLDGDFTIFHGITNILRHGDFSFVDLGTMRITQIGELKTKKVSDNNFTLTLTVIKRLAKANQTQVLPINDNDLKETKKGRQLLGILNLLNPTLPENSKRATLVNPHYGKDIQELINETKIGTIKTKQVSSGLAFSCIKLNKATLFHRIIYKKITRPNEMQNQIVKVALNLVKKNSLDNGIILGQLLYRDDYTDNNTPGTVPLFWHPINKKLLRSLYFGECIVMSIFNPAHLIAELEEMGYIIDSRYATRKTTVNEKAKKTLKRFDLFISSIINFLMAESYVINAVKEIEKTPLTHPQTEIAIRIQQHFDLYDFAS